MSIRPCEKNCGGGEGGKEGAIYPETIFWEKKGFFPSSSFRFSPFSEIGAENREGGGEATHCSKSVHPYIFCLTGMPFPTYRCAAKKEQKRNHCRLTMWFHLITTSHPAVSSLITLVGVFCCYVGGENGSDDHLKWGEGREGEGEEISNTQLADSGILNALWCGSTHVQWGGLGGGFTPLLCPQNPPLP